MIVLPRGAVVQGAMEALVVVGAQVALEASLPGRTGRRCQAIPVFLFDGTLHSFHLTVEVRATWPDAAVADVTGPEPATHLLTKLGAVISLDAAQGEGESL